MFDKPEFYRQVGIRIQIYRKRRSLTQQDVAAAVGIPRTTYANVERGRQSIAVDLLWRLSVFFNTSMDRLSPEPLRGRETSADLHPSDPLALEQSEPVYITREPTE
jgi:transcriptional regulator with XRE-family HTH domain